MSFTFVAVDVETAASRWDSICSVGLIRVNNGIITDSFYTLINPECDFDPMNIRINGIRPEMVISEPRFCDVADAITKFIGYDTLVAHNIIFDGSALSKSYRRYGKTPLSVETFCTYQYAKELKKKDLIYADKLGLDDLCIQYNIPLEHRHNALDDAKACALLLLSLAKEVKASSFAELREITHQGSSVITSKTKIGPYPFKTDPIDLWRIGDDLRKEGKISEALEVLEKSKKAGNRSPALFSSFAMAYHKLKNYEAEISIIDEFLAGNTYGHSQEFISRKGKAKAALEAQRTKQQAIFEKERSKEESKAKKEVKTKSPRVYEGRAIAQLMDDGTVVKIHDTIAAAVRDTKISSKSIRDAANGVQRHAGGFCWKYADQM